ncbi:MAG: hypothetical protein DHS20C18_50290 [Saprospiraceae bacterium]|nr:MAG: hypothetical protein DHS20C18_50290 [Saprospiraceae bacterium]
MPDVIRENKDFKPWLQLWLVGDNGTWWRDRKCCFNGRSHGYLTAITNAKWGTMIGTIRLVIMVIGFMQLDTNSGFYIK